MTDLETAAALYVATFGPAALPESGDELLERAEAEGPHVQNLIANALHHHGWERLLEALRAAGGGAS